MTNEEITIAIAEACGWIYLKNIEDEDGEKYLIGVLKGRPSGPIVPDYCNDLNAMHEAWLSLSEEDKFVFDKELQLVVIRAKDGQYWLTNSTALQRAEAFLKTIGKWEGAK